MQFEKADKSGPNLDSLSVLDERGSRKYVYPADAKGRWSRLKPKIYAVLIAIYVALPFIPVGGHPAVHIDFINRHFYLFGATFNAQDFYLAFFVLTGIGFSLIVVAGMWGRLFCGWACPQTVFLDGLFRRIERWIEGPAAKRRRLADGPWSREKILKRLLKHSIYLVLSILIAHVFLAYFTSMNGLAAMIGDGPDQHLGTFLWAAGITAVIYGNFWWFREQLCIVICPYGRLQSALQDKDTINIQYDALRGEPRGKAKARDKGEVVGDCIECNRCIAVCPTGIDIRNGHQLECIGCAYCIDACDEVMVKIGRPVGLIRYDSQAGVEGEKRRFWRPRVYFYLAIGLILFTVGGIVMSRNDTFEVNLLRVQGAPFTLTEANLENTLRLHLVNKRSASTVFTVAPTEKDQGVVFLPQTEVRLETFQGFDMPVFVKIPLDRYKHGMHVHLVVTDSASGESEEVPIEVLGPRRPVRKAATERPEERDHGKESPEKGASPGEHR